MVVDVGLVVNFVLARSRGEVNVGDDDGDITIVGNGKLKLKIFMEVEGGYSCEVVVSCIGTVEEADGVLCDS